MADLDAALMSTFDTAMTARVACEVT